jgi:hypothetical protein
MKAARMDDGDGHPAEHRAAQSGRNGEARIIEANREPAPELEPRGLSDPGAAHVAIIAAMEGCDAIAFTGGIGENARAVRADILGRLGWLGVRIDPALNETGGPRLHAAGTRMAAWVLPADEEREIARDAIGLLQQN